MQRLLKIKYQIAALSLAIVSTAAVAVFIPVTQPPAAPSAPAATAPAASAEKNVSLPTAALANPPALKDDPKYWADRVKARAQQRWQLIIDKKYGESFDYLTIASKGFTTQDQYAAQTASANYAEATVHEVVCEPESCRAEIRAFVDLRVPRMPAPIRTPLFLNERWIVEDGEARLLRR